MEVSLGGLESVLKPDSRLRISPQNCSGEDISELWPHEVISALMLDAVIGTLETHGLWPLPPSSSK